MYTQPETFEYNGKWIKNWFSNMVESPIEIDGLTWPSVENYYQAMKSTDKDDHERFTTLTPSQSKREGRKLRMRPDWEAIKYDVMKKALEVKFAIPEWKQQLLATADEDIVEWNNWGDRIWGVDVRDNKGTNLLGIALMELREELKKEL